ncbi:MAG: DnaD domain protein [Chloroflexota bacterium]|nr:DnaD domain protein [Chloroflexota bacterium]
MSAKQQFEGFPERTDYTSIPNPFFSAILPQIRDLAELKVTLHIFWALYRKKGYPKFITLSELRGNQPLMSGIVNEGSAEEQLRNGLDAALSRGTLLRLMLERDEESDDLYFLNNMQSQRAIEQIEKGDIQLSGIVRIEPANTEEIPNIFTLYEQHIGILTPMIAEDLKEAEKLYPASWIEDAFRESVRLNKRSWRYISRILERWASQGRDYGGTRQNSQEDVSPREYIRRYGHLTRR